MIISELEAAAIYTLKVIRPCKLKFGITSLFAMPVEVPWN